MNFWSEQNWTGRYEGPRSGQHRGLDVGNIGARGAVPALRGGTVSAIAFHGQVGWYIVIDTGASNDPFRFDSYCHVHDARVAVGDRVHAGQVLCLAAGPGDDPGSAWTGPHLHFTVTDGPSPLTGHSATNPEPIVRAAAPAATASDIHPLPKDPEQMIIYQAESDSNDGVIRGGVTYIQEGSPGTLRALSAPEWDTYNYFSARGIPFRLAVWPGDDIRELTKRVGVMQFSDQADNYPRHTGRVIYEDADRADFPRSSAGGAS